MRETIGEAAQQGLAFAPATVSALLRTLHMEHVPVGRHKPVLRGWLIEHPPSSELRLSLRSNGYGALLRDLPC